MISREGAVKVALDVIDEHGLAGFGLNLVAARLGVKTPSLYHHFRGRAEILSEVARSLFIGARLRPIAEVKDWREEVVSVSLHTWRSILRHPQAAPLLLEFYPRAILAAAYEYWAEMFAANGVPTTWHFTILEGSDKITYGSALFSAALRIAGVDPLRSSEEQDHRFLAAASQAHHMNEERTFEQVLRCFLLGVPV